MTHELIQRMTAVEAVTAHYDAKPFAWGKNDCVRMTAFHLRKLGHKIALIKGGAYSNAFGAARALKRAGYDSLEAALDERFERIAPAYTLVGDIIGMESGGEWPALTIRMSNGRIFGFGEGRAGVMQPHAFKTAWRVTCLK